VRIVYSQKALAQLDAIYSYIHERNPRAALSVKARIDRAIARLGSFPDSGRRTRMSGIRMLPIVRYPYLVFYSVDQERQTVFILRVRHGARNPLRHLE
jgi:toxin ParE1/3/4